MHTQVLTTDDTAALIDAQRTIELRASKDGRISCGSATYDAGSIKLLGK